MKIYLDDDTVASLLVKLLHRAGHDVLIPNSISLSGVADPVHLTKAIGEGRVFMTKNTEDFEELHYLIQAAGGRHPGIIQVYQTNDPSRDLSVKGIVNAIRKLEAAGVPISNELIVLNHWR